jgi:hypothetical protein
MKGDLVGSWGDRDDVREPRCILAAMKGSLSNSSSPPIQVNWRAAFGIAAALIVLFTLQNYLAPPVTRAPPTLQTAFVIQLINWSIWLLLLPTIARAAQRFRGSTGLRREQLPRQLLTAARIALTHGLLAGFVRWVAGVSVSHDALEATISFAVVNFAPSYIRTWLIAAAFHALAYYQEARYREVSAARLETSLTQARLETLQGKLQPHFLFNTLNSIMALIRENPLSAEAMVGNLGELLRASLSSTSSQEISLGEELLLVEKYTDIERVRFQERLQVNFEVPAQLHQARVPHLLLQPLVENAIRHGLAPRETGGLVRVLRAA